ncbi:carbamoylphosphate synthase large subunit [Caldisphaera lagunensis DSM 15908]|uniref:Carbamoyl phosphate synthase large chain n=1 Tax=Caldisphaera lagunensis (strain DSM 15908 / JCM 11604 / ANMR 0165 / IC-154) TaxID=1056495 RepID=L0ADK6_CALLD|nr:carbamoyl-phosphate synthase (glutamine-hydrolyzing) large subunit [Caldisphaera lagunensis]AFZ71212.1 carbamoylphosphate synthase large subunit [Caldisphaera lagunensis DSM 15908]
MREAIKKVLVIGSGPIKIAEAAEFDYSGSQALKAIKEEGIETILVSPNVATIQTSYRMADKIYMLPINFESLSNVIEMERPDGIMIGFGGQTALNVGIELYDKGVLKKYGVNVLGTPIDGIKRALSREKFRETMIKHNIPVPLSFSSRNEDDALNKARKLGYPIMIRVSYNLGGRGSFVAWNEDELKNNLKKAFSQSYINEVLLEKYLHHYKELEYEVMRDSYGNKAVIACIENLDPMGVHTGESIVISPCQTIDNNEYQTMRTLTMRVADSIDLIGESNVQFALSPISDETYVIETNPRMSRSSALASKITGYPLAYVSAKLAFGYKIYEIINKITGITTSCFEPSLDYVAIKIPRWDLNKFEKSEKSIDSEMKSIGEVMGIGRSFEEAFQKAIRMLDINEEIVENEIYNSDMSKEEALCKLKERNAYWFLYLSKAIKEGASDDEIYEKTGIDKFYISKIRNIILFYEELKKLKNIDYDHLLKAKKLGFSDRILAKAIGIKEEDVRDIRLKNNLSPKIKQIDTLAGEWPAISNYMYTTYNGFEDDIKFNEDYNILIIGSGVFRIGVSVEFDWGTVSLIDSLKKYHNVYVLNYNPETVSTDWDIAKQLFFDEINIERILDITGKTKTKNVVLFTSGQIGNNLAKELEEMGLNIYGTSGKSIDIAEDREKFSIILDKLGIKQPPWFSAKNIKEVMRFVDEIGFPVLVRPSYVLSGASMRIAYNIDELIKYINSATKVSPRHPIIITKYFEDSIEAEIDGVSDSKGVIGVLNEHVEEAGVHSGDSTMVIPHRKIREEVANEMGKISLMLSNELKIKGPFNLQFVIKDSIPYIIELNLRQSRSFPFSSKAVGMNLIDLSVKAIEDGLDLDGFELIKPKSFGVKSPQFSWSQLKGAYPSLGVEMKSTGEAASFDFTFHGALLKSWLSISPNRLPNINKSILIYGIKNLFDLKEASKTLEEMGYNIYTIDELGISGKELNYEKAYEMTLNKKIDLIITDGFLIEKDYKIRRTAADLNIPIILNGKLGKEISMAMKENKYTFYENKAYGVGI